MHTFELILCFSDIYLLKKEDIAETAGGVDNNSGLSPTDNIFNMIIINCNENVNDR